MYFVYTKTRESLLRRVQNSPKSNLSNLSWIRNITQLADIKIWHSQPALPTHGERKQICLHNGKKNAIQTSNKRGTENSKWDWQSLNIDKFYKANIGWNLAQARLFCFVVVCNNQRTRFLPGFLISRRYQDCSLDTGDFGLHVYLSPPLMLPDVWG